MNKITINELLALRNSASRSKPLPGPQWPPSVYYRYLAALVARMKPQVFVELGTCGGGAARNVAMVNPDVLVISIDVNKLPQVSLIERDCKNFRFVCGDSVGLAETIGKENTGKIGVMFIDTIHEYQHTMNEFNAWRPYLADGAVVCFDDLNRQGMDRVWRELPGIKTGFSDLSAMHISGSPTDGGFGALII